MIQLSFDSYHHSGDNDPLDAVEIGSATGEVGQVKQVKVLGTWGMIDAGMNFSHKWIVL